MKKLLRRLKKKVVCSFMHQKHWELISDESFPEDNWLRCTKCKREFLYPK